MISFSTSEIALTSVDAFQSLAEAGGKALTAEIARLAAGRSG